MPVHRRTHNDHHVLGFGDHRRIGRGAQPARRRHFGERFASARLPEGKTTIVDDSHRRRVDVIQEDPPAARSQRDTQRKPYVAAAPHDDHVRWERRHRGSNGVRVGIPVLCHCLPQELFSVSPSQSCGGSPARTGQATTSRTVDMIMNRPSTDHSIRQKPRSTRPPAESRPRG